MIIMYFILDEIDFWKLVIEIETLKLELNIEIENLKDELKNCKWNQINWNWNWKLEIEIDNLKLELKLEIVIEN
jgi:hypothetical protein